MLRGRGAALALGAGLTLAMAIPAQAGFRNAYAVNISTNYSVLEVQEAADGGFAVAGGRPMFLLKTDVAGDLEFHQRWDADAAASLDVTPDGGFLIAGEQRSYDLYLVTKTDAAGLVEWSRTYTQSSSAQGLYSIRATPDGGAITAGIFTVKIDAAGAAEWSAIHVGGGGNSNCIRPCSSGGYIATGEGAYGNPADGYNIVVTRLDSAGDVTWNRTFGGDEYDWSAACEEADDGGFIVAGWTASFGAGGSDGFLIKLDSSGDVEWAFTYGTAGDDALHSVFPLADGGFVAAGRLDGQAGFVRVDSDGALLWSQAYPASVTARSSTFHSIRETSTGGFVAAGKDESSRLLLVLTDASGDTGGCDQVSPATIAAPAPFLTGINNTFGRGAFAGSDVTLTQAPMTPALVPCTPTANRPPSCQAGPDMLAACDGFDLLGASASDPDGDALSHAWSSSCTGTRFEPSADVANPRVHLDQGCEATCELVLEVSDGRGGTCTDTMTVTVSCSSDPSADCDGDGTTNGSDCAPADPTAFALPADPMPLLVGADPVSRDALLTWPDVAPASGSSTVSDVISGRIADLWLDRGFTSASCLVDDAAVTARDPRPLPPALPGFPNPGWYYLVRAQGGCGSPGFGDDAFGARLVDPLICP